LGIISRRGKGGEGFPVGKLKGEEKLIYERQVKKDFSRSKKGDNFSEVGLRIENRKESESLDEEMIFALGR